MDIATGEEGRKRRHRRAFAGGRNGGGGGILGGLGYAHWHYRALLGASALAASLALVYLLYWRWQNRRDTTY